jgi:reverse gyrase
MVFMFILFCTEQAMDRFRANENSVLIATDVAARGLDIPHVRTVIHYQLPHSAEVELNVYINSKLIKCFGCSTKVTFSDRFTFTEVAGQRVHLLMGVALL